MHLNWRRALTLQLRLSAMLGVLGAGCTRADRTTEQRVNDSAATALPVALMATTISYELPDHITNMHDKQFYNWLHGTNPPRWRGKAHKTDRTCAGHAKCDRRVFPEQLTVHIDAAADAIGLHLENIPDKGVVMAKITIDKPDDPVKDSKYGFIYEHEYYIVVEPDAGKTDGHQKPIGKWYLVDLDKDGNQSNTMSSGVFRRCYPEHPPAADAKSHAGFTYCNVTNDTGRTPSHVRVEQLLTRLDSAENSVRGLTVPTAAQKAEIEKTRAALASEFIKEATGPAWMSCSHGCCIGDTST